MQERNWAGNITFGATRLHRPETVDEVREIVRESAKLRVLGAGHSFNTIADAAEDQLLLDRLAPVFDVDHARQTVTVDAGIRYGALCEQVHAAGYALPNTASLPHITLTGAIATATHGSGDGNGCLATSVRAMTFVAASGEVVTLPREHDRDQFAGAVVGLGSLGVVTRVTLALIPAFTMRQDVYEHLPWARLEEHFPAIMGSGYSVSLFTDWQDDAINQVWVKRQAPEGDASPPLTAFFGATPAPHNLHPLPILPAAHCTPQMGVVGPWHERLPHFRMEFTPSGGDELQSEYFVPRDAAIPALRALRAMRAEITPHLWMSEVRTIAADDLWMSPFYQRASVALHFTWKKDWEGVRALLPRIEAALAPFAPAPHWGKLFTMPPREVQARYARLPEFRQLLRHYDPEGIFRNTFVDRCIFGAS